MEELTDQQKAILDFEREFPMWSNRGSREAMVRRHLDLSITRYLQILNGLLDNPAALKYRPDVVRRLHGLREDRKSNRSSKRLRDIQSGTVPTDPDPAAYQPSII